MKDIIFATGNAGKMKEVRQILEDLGVSVYSLKDAGIDAEVEENGTTFSQNAVLKAEGIASWCRDNGIPAMPKGASENLSCWPTIPAWRWTA